MIDFLYDTTLFVMAGETPRFRLKNQNAGGQTQGNSEDEANFGVQGPVWYFNAQKICKGAFQRS